MLVGSVLTSHTSLAGTQAAVYGVHDGQLFELLRDVTPGVLLSWMPLGSPPTSCVAYPPLVVWASDSSQPIRVFCTTSSGTLAARLLAHSTRVGLSWEGHGGANSPSVFTPPGASVEWFTTVGPGCLGSLFGAKTTTTLSNRSLFVGATDGSLWERTQVGGGSCQWVSHGNPPGSCVVGVPMTDPALVPPASPLRIFAAAASGALVERIIRGPSGDAWVDHGRPSGAAGPIALGSGGVVIADLARSDVEVFVTSGEAMHRLSVPTLGMPGSWTTLSPPPPTVPGEGTWITSNPGGATLVAGPPALGDFFVVATRRSRTGALVGTPVDELWHCRADLSVPNDLVYVANLGAPGRPQLAGTSYYVVSDVLWHAAPLGRVYASSRPSQGGLDSLDEWTYTPGPASAGLGLPPALPAPCTGPPPTMTGCGGPRHFEVGFGL